MFIPGCYTCNCTCIVASANFTGTNGTVPAGWTVASGTWAINSNELRCTAAGIIVFDTTWPTTDRWRVNLTLTNNNSTTHFTFRILHNYVDTDNHYFQEWRVTKISATANDVRASCVALGQRVAGVETIFHQVDGGGTWGAIFSEFGDDLFAGTAPGLFTVGGINNHGQVIAAELSAVTPAGKVAIQVTDLGSGTQLTFDSFEWSRCPTFALLDCAGGILHVSPMSTGFTPAITCVTLTAGTWSTLNSNVSPYTIGGFSIDSYFIPKIVYPHWNSYMRIETTVTLGTLHGFAPRLLLDVIDENNYVFGEILIDTGPTANRARIGTVVAGTETILLDEDASGLSITFLRLPMSLCLTADGQLILNETWSTSYTPDTGDTSPRYYGVGGGNYDGGGASNFEGTYIRKIADDDNAGCFECVGP